MGSEILGYARPIGRAGVRNHVVILSIMDNANPTARHIASLVRGATLICTSFGRGQLGVDAEMRARALVGLASNPNVFATLIVSMEPESAKQIVTKIEASRRPVASVTVMGDGGSLAAVAKGASWVAEQLLAASRQKRELVPLSDLIIGVECGGSDTTSGIAANPAIGNAADALVDSGASIILSETSEWLGGEHLLARRADTPEIGGQILQAVAQIEQDAIQRGVDLVGQQPSYDNMKGGLSTIEEKTLGAIQKGGSRPIVGFLEYAQSPRKPGLHVMDTFAGAVESMTALSAGGCQIILFATGQGNPIGDQIAPTLKVCGNAETLSRLAEHVDIDVSAVISGLMSMEEAGALVLAATKELAEGRKCFCEILGQEETTISRFERSI